MNGRVAVLAGAAVLVALAGQPGTAAGQSAKQWCMTYCDAIQVGCEKTIGWLDPDACTEWHAGCLEGCRVNER